MKNPANKHKLTDAERDQRFLDIAKAVEVSTEKEAFDKAVRRVAGPKSARRGPQHKEGKT